VRGTQRKRRCVGLGQRLYEIRTARGLTLDALGSMAAVSKGFLSGIENGRSEPTASVILAAGNRALRVGRLAHWQAAASARPGEQRSIEERAWARHVLSRPVCHGFRRGRRKVPLRRVSAHARRASDHSAALDSQGLAYRGRVYQ